MLVGILRFFKGSVRFRATGQSPERLLNLCAQRGVALWNARPTAEGLEAVTTARDYKKLRPIARRARVKTKMLSKRGAPFIAAKYKGRIGIPVGAAIGAALLVVLSQFLWTINVTGLHTVSEQRLRSLLTESGVKTGAFKHTVDTAQAKRDILLQVDEIGWLSVNICGSHADVEVKEKTRKPEVEESETPCNIKASEDGVITKITAAQGVTEAKVGSGVIKGELLISGVNLTKQNTVRYVRAKGEVWADVISKKELSLSKEQEYISLKENSINRSRLNFMGVQLPCSLSFRSFAQSAFTGSTSVFTLNGNPLPLGLVTETEWELEPHRESCTAEQAKRVFDTSLLLCEIFEHGSAEKTSKQVKIEETAGSFLCHADYVFNENIAESVDFSVEE